MIFKKLTARLAHTQLMTNRSRALWTLLGIVLSAAMITAVFSFVASGIQTLEAVLGEDFYSQGVYRYTILGFGAFLSAIILISSMVVVSNAFRVSAGERMTQFGILKSVGATKKQISQTVMYEGVMLSIIGIPAGVLIGLFVEFAGLEIANYLLGSINSLNNAATRLEFNFVVSWQAILLSVVISYLTVIISAWLPARKAARIPAIDAIRGSGEVKVKAKIKRLRANKLAGRLFGFEGTLASKSLKRSRRSFRATVTSLTISVIMFITVSSFAQQVLNATDIARPVGTTDILAEYIDGRMDVKGMNDITDKMRAYKDSNVFGLSQLDTLYRAVVPDEMLTRQMRKRIEAQNAQSGADYIVVDEGYSLRAALMTVDDKHYAELCETAGVPYGSNILVNDSRLAVDGRRAEYSPLIFSGQTLNLIDHNGETLEVPLHGELGKGEVPTEMLFIIRREIVVLVPDVIGEHHIWLADTSDRSGFTEHSRNLLFGAIPEQEGLERIIVISDIATAVEASTNVNRLMVIFVYGFVGMLTLIGLTNVISTISANVRSRSREFSVLKSVGMTQGGIKRMLNLESVLCSVRSLIIGIPIGGLVSFFIYRSFAMSIEFGYRPPWVSALQCVAGVSAITWITMQFAASRLRNRNLAEEIRKESSM